MFTQKWRQHWGLSGDPFACEDADKDVVLEQVDASAVHSCFDRIFGNPVVPAPGIVFGEKGSGKSGLRLMMKRHIDAHNEQNHDARVFHVEYIDFDLYIEHFRAAIGAGGDSQKAANQIVKRWTIADHLDCILSLGVTQLVATAIASREAARRLTRKQKLDLQLLCALYHDSRRATTTEALRKLGSAIKVRRPGRRLGLLPAFFMTAVGASLAFLPHQGFREFDGLGPDKLWYLLGAIVVGLTWLWVAWSKIVVDGAARRASKSLRVLPRNPRPVAAVLAGHRARDRAEFVLPHQTDEGTRYDLLHRFLGLLEGLGYAGCYVLVDRVDEPSLLSGNDERMRGFVEPLLDIKLLQYPKLALKLFLPIEMEALYRNASSDELKRMRLDKSNLIPELKWAGEELYEIAEQRLRACSVDGETKTQLSDLFEEGFDMHHLKETLTSLGSPRYALGFLSAAFVEYVRELPGELDADDERWRLPRAHFDVVRGAWIDRTGLLRRSLN